MPRGPRRIPEKSKDFVGSIKRLLKELRTFKIFVVFSILLAIGSSILSFSAPDKLSSLVNEISYGLVVNTETMGQLTNKVTTTVTENVQIIMSDPNTAPEIKAELVSMMSSSQMDFSKINPAIIIRLFSEFEIDGVTISVSDQIESMMVLSSLNKDVEVSQLYEKIEQLPASVKSVIEPKMNFNNIKSIVLVLSCIYLCSAIFSYLQAIIMRNVSNNFARSLRNRITKKINVLPLKYFDNNQTGDVLSRITNDVDTISQTMNNSLASLVSAFILFFGTLFMMFITSVPMALTAILSSIIGFMGMGGILGKSQKYFIARQVELGKLNSHIEEVYSGLQVVKVYNGQKETTAKFDEANQRVYEANRKSQFLSGIMGPLMGFVGNFGYVSVCVVGALLTMNGKISFGTIIAFMTYVRMFTNPLSQIAQAAQSLQSAAAASERVFEFLDETELEDESNFTEVLLKEEAKGFVEFRNVHFGYDPERTIINDFSAKALPGQKIAIVGPTGAGKTTIVNLLMKFYKVNSGDILIDGKSINNLTRDNIHSLFTMVLQDTWMFSGTIRDNIVYNCENVTDERIMEVCDSVGLTHFINTMPQKLDTELLENDNVSAGQKQLITIARGMIENSPFLILDEATSNVDTRTEELVQKAMDKLMEGRTSFIIAHRLSTIRNADLILVMKDGDIIESGNHQQLMEANGFYSQLYNSQFESFS